MKISPKGPHKLPGSSRKEMARKAVGRCQLLAGDGSARKERGGQNVCSGRTTSGTNVWSPEELAGWGCGKECGHRYKGCSKQGHLQGVGHTSENPEMERAQRD